LKFLVNSFWTYSNAFIFKIPASGTDFQNTGFLPASAKLAVKYRPSRNPTTEWGHAKVFEIGPALSNAGPGCDPQKMVFVCFSANLGRHFVKSNNVGRHFAQIFKDFA